MSGFFRDVGSAFWDLSRNPHVREVAGGVLRGVGEAAAEEILRPYIGTLLRAVDTLREAEERAERTGQNVRIGSDTLRSAGIRAEVTPDRSLQVTFQGVTYNVSNTGRLTSASVDREVRGARIHGNINASTGTASLSLDEYQRRDRDRHYRRLSLVEITPYGTSGRYVSSRQDGDGASTQTHVEIVPNNVSGYVGHADRRRRETTVVSGSVGRNGYSARSSLQRSRFGYNTSIRHRSHDEFYSDGESSEDEYVGVRVGPRS